MIPVLTPQQMAALDRWAIEVRGIPAFQLMETAGRRVAEAVMRAVSKDRSVVILAGPGNNGGDAFIVAREMAREGHKHTLITSDDDGGRSADAGTAYATYRSVAGETSIRRISEVRDDLRMELEQADGIVDGLFGTGLGRNVEGLYADLIDASNKNRRGVKIAIDIPSGLHGEDGRVLGRAFRADTTVTFQCPKRGFFVADGPSLVGRIAVVDIGIPIGEYDGVADRLFYLDAGDFALRELFKRDWASHKKQHGHVALVGGSPGMIGANCLAARAAFRVGAGVVTAAFPRSALKQFDKRICPMFVPNCLLMSLKDQRGDLGPPDKAFTTFLSTADAVGIGCGLRIGPRALGDVLKGCRGPVVVDAGALEPLSKLLRQKRRRRKGGTVPPAGGSIIITPHVGEMSKMSGLTRAVILRDRISCVRDYACGHGIFALLKGAYSVIGLPDGTVLVNGSGNPGMATAGMGDVLTGMMTGILGQPLELELWRKVAMAVWLHGAVGDFCARELTEVSMTAADVIEGIPAFLRSQGVD